MKRRRAAKHLWLKPALAAGAGNLKASGVIRLRRTKWILLLMLVCGCVSSRHDFHSDVAARVVSSVPLPVEIEDDHVFVRTTVNGHDLRLMLDTGATHLAITSEAARSAGVITTAEMSIGTFGNLRGAARLGLAGSAVVGPAVAERVPIAVFPIPEYFGDGLLGLSFLRQFAFRLDYDRALLSLGAPAQALPGATALNLAPEDSGLLTVLAAIDGQPAKLLVDTGAGQGLIPRPWFVEQHQLRKRYPRRLAVVTGGNVLGLMRGEITRLQSIRLGSHVLSNELVEFEGKANEERTDIAGTLGSGILSRFNLTFDLQVKRLWLEPNASYQAGPKPSAPVRSGLVCRPDFVVADIVPDSPAAEAGARPGDRLLEVNGVPVSRLKHDCIKQALRAAPGSRVRLQLQTANEPSREAILILRELL